jgi:hypothetical protein
VIETIPNVNSVLSVRGFPTLEDQRNAIVLRYLTFRKFVSLLKLEAMWFSRLVDLALLDALEGTLPSKARQCLIARHRKYTEQFAASPEILERIKTMTDKGMAPGRDMFAVNCWFLGSQETEKMWNDYGEKGNGVAVRSTVERLSTSFQNLGGLAKVSVIDRVQYIDFESHDMSENDALNVDKVAFLKNKSLAHEKEVRILTPSIRFNPDGISLNKDQFTQKGLNIKCQLQTLIQSVVVGPCAEPHFFTLIERLVGRYRLCVDVEKSQLSNFTSRK